MKRILVAGLFCLFTGFAFAQTCAEEYTRTDQSLNDGNIENKDLNKHRSDLCYCEGQAAIKQTETDTTNFARNTEVKTENPSINTATLKTEKAEKSKFGNGIENVGNAIGEGAKHTGKAIGKGAKYTGKAIGEGAKHTGKAIGKSAAFAGKQIKKGTKEVVKGTEDLFDSDELEQEPDEKAFEIFDDNDDVENFQDQAKYEKQKALRYHDTNE